MTDAVYLDHNATTPVDPEVRLAMEPYLEELFGNPSSVEHEHGHRASVAVEKARAQVAAAIGARPNEIIFTGGCTEANNMAIFGAARANPERRHLITTAIEHPAVLEPMRALEKQGWRLTILGVDADGVVSVDQVERALSEETALVSVMGANNEVGSLQPIADIGALCAERGVLFHCDAAQIAAYSSLNVERDNVHIASLSGHKAYGPKGVGAIYIRSRKPRVRLQPIIFGGGQERGLRPGTLNTLAIVGMGEAFQIAERRGTDDTRRLSTLTQEFRDRLLEALPGAYLNGHPTRRLPNNLSFSIDGVEPLALIRRLRDEMSFSATSACATEKIETSPVLLAMFGDTSRARGAFRISPGRFTTAEQMSSAAELLIAEAHRLLGTMPAAA
jgi:cysteine desulfurase